MNELVAKIKELSNAFFMDAELQTEKGNKAAGTRARKASLELEKLLKEFRKASLEEAKAICDEKGIDPYEIFFSFMICHEIHSPLFFYHLYFLKD